MYDTTQFAWATEVRNQQINTEVCCLVVTTENSTRRYASELIKTAANALNTHLLVCTLHIGKTTPVQHEI